jgi:hypothetical protein
MAAVDGFDRWQKTSVSKKRAGVSNRAGKLFMPGPVSSGPKTSDVMMIHVHICGSSQDKTDFWSTGCKSY